ncbi:uncharacterized protein [Drosophila kikkawai]|uniref:C2H2-type domain-containing protein n=1 Tax=Drosophila kikkawai TaxID=30033 RepID=A0A6P4IBI9_DROKI|nr:uncharacterized protein LOC108073874 [Drosophila kikkawai]
MESSSSAALDMEGSGTGDPSQPTQITSIDGFFNRKRGRPPKNRFVEVYKSAQHSPQAIFTSFKLERSDHPAVAASMGEGLEERLSRTDHDGSTSSTITDLNPSRNRKRGRVWAPTSITTEHSSRRQLPHLTGRTEATLQSSRIESLAQPTLPAKEAVSSSSKIPSSRELEKKSVVRAAGTFYPENINSSTQQEVPEENSSQYRQESFDLDVDQPEDLSMRSSLPETTKTSGESLEPALNMNLLHFKQLIDLYQRQVLLPSFLAAASQPLTGPGAAGSAAVAAGAATLPGSMLDVRLILENAAHQKLLLLNAAAAATASATAAAAAAAASSEAVQRPPTVKRSRDHDIPTGYLKFRFNEDCNFERCGYRNHQSHFHCNRRDCHYSFCDKTRFVQHTARHERMDTLMGDDFRQFRANMQCGVASCSFGVTEASSQQQRIDDSSGSASKKTSHFHCRKCDYVCTDSNKVVAHRRLHLRQDYVRSAGFRKVGGNEACNSASCSYALRHTHYHCVTCDGGVLSRAQLAAHKHRTPLAKTETAT